MPLPLFSISNRWVIHFGIFVSISLLLLACSPGDSKQLSGGLSSKIQQKPSEPDGPSVLESIQKTGTLKAITIYSSTSYFIYKGEPLGYEYELLEMLADHLNLELEIVVASDIDKLEDMLESGEGDLIAYGLTITKERQKRMAFTAYHNYTRQVLVQRKPKNWRKLKQHELEQSVVRNVINLIGKPVSIREKSSYFERLQNLSEEIGGDIGIDLVPGTMSTDEIISKVADGTYEFTFADQNIALINQTYLPNLDVATAVSFPQRIAWAVRKDSPELLKAVNDWILKARGTRDYNFLYKKYFKNTKAFRKRVESDYFSYKGGDISPYDSLIKVLAHKIDWDWRLLASMVYQESEFDPAARSWVGASGLMQLMPATALEFGAKDREDPVENLKAGVAFIDRLYTYWNNIPDSMEKTKFVIASYNVGMGHVSDARKLAEKYGKNPDRWDEHVAEFLRLKSKPEYFNDPICRYGYCRGEEPYRYVREILDRYEHYQNFTQ